MTSPEPLELNASAQILAAREPIANLVVFGGLRAEGGYGVPAFEFVQTLRNASFNVLFVKDVTRRWYNFALKGFSISMDDTVVQIESALKTHFPDDLPLACLGNSMGGYAALVFGERLRADFVLSIVPQTIIAVGARRRLGDSRWNGDFSKFEPALPDVRDVLRGGARKIQIVVGRKSIPDIIQAANLSGADRVHIEIVAGARHDVTKGWKEAGVLQAEVVGRLIEGLELEQA